MEASLSPDMLATDLAYYLVRKGVSTFELFNILFLSWAHHLQFLLNFGRENTCKYKNNYSEGIIYGLDCLSVPDSLQRGS